MKKLITLFSLLLTLCLLVACASPAAPAEEPAPDSEAPADNPSSDSDLPNNVASDEDLPAEDDAPVEPGANLTDSFVQPDGSYKFTRANFPRMDGSTSLVPLAEAVASVLLGESREQVQDLVQFNRTTQSFENLMYGLCDILIVGEPNARVFDRMKEENFEYELEVIGHDALVFVVNADNPVDSLTTDQIRDIYAGKITNWKEVGGNDAPIIPFQRNENAGSQALMKKLIMQDTELMTPPTDYIVDSMAGLMESVREYDNSANAIGYSVYYYAHDMEMAHGLKLIKVDGVAPSRDTIRTGEYPHRSDNCCVIPKDAPEGSPNRVIFDWLMTEEGQKLVSAEGYVPIMDVE